MCYASRTCSDTEAKLGPTDGELLAIVYAVEKFHCYVAGTRFVVVTDHSALVHLNEAKTKNAKLARWAMRLASYDFTLKHRAGRVHHNADGLSRARAAPSPDTPPPEDAPTTPRDPDLLLAALEAFAGDPTVDGDPADLLPPTPNAPSATLGPRQLLLEAAPCTACHTDFATSGVGRVVCDRCNAPYHLRCTRLKALPPTYWYCRQCATCIRARGIRCPTEDLALQTYLLTGHAPLDLLPSFRLQANHLTFTTQLLTWRDHQWVPYPPAALQVLLMEETHVQHMHVGGEKVFRVLKERYFWPNMRAYCVAFVGKCFECQLSAGRSHGGWQGKILPLPAGPRCEWSVDLITNLGPATGPKHHLLTAVCCYSKFCVLSLLQDKSSLSVATLLRDRVFGVFGWPAVLRSDNGTEFKGAVDELCLAKNIKHKRSAPYTSHSNGVVERLHCTLEDLLR